MLLLIEEAKNHKAELRQQISEVLQKLAETNHTHKLRERLVITEIKIKDDDRMTGLAKTLTHKKIDKFQSDKQDYNAGAVYSWQCRPFCTS